MPPHRITIAFHAGDPESFVYAGQLGNIFQRAGWQIHTSSRVYGRGLRFGISVDGPDNPTVEAALTALKCAEGLELYRNISWLPPDLRFDDNTVPGGPEVIFVGVKDRANTLTSLMQGEY